MKQSRTEADGTTVEEGDRRYPYSIMAGKAMMPGGRWEVDENIRTVITDRAERLRVWRHFQSPEGALIGAIFGRRDPRAGYDGYLEEWRGRPPGYFGALDAFTLTPQIANALHAAGIVTAADLCGKTPTELLKMKNIGRSALAKIEQALEAKGLTLKKEGQP
jgi:hypothetical protein